jgi:two-component system chemotaxis sensor kinase CheA
MEEFIAEFIAESTTIIETLQGLLMAYEESSSKDQVAEELFRGIHTLKGTSKMFGFDAIEKATHQLEDILDEHRKKPKTYTADFIDLNLRVLDYCLQVLNSKDSIKDLELVLDSISKYQDNTSLMADTNASQIFCILFKPGNDIFDRGVNPVNIFEELQSLGTFNYFPSKKETSIAKQAARKKLEKTFFDLWICTEKNHQDIEDVFMFMKTIEYTIVRFDHNSEVIFSKIGEERKKDFSKIERSLRLDFIAQNQKTVRDVPATAMESVREEKPEMSVERKTESDSKLNYINVALPKLDQMMNLVSEFVTLSGEVKHYAGHLSSDGLQNIAERLEKVSTLFRDNAFSMRLVPIQILSIKLQRHVKELSSKLGKKVRFITEGMDTEIDKSIINQIEGPLMHIIRNAMDHGFEKASDRLAKGKPEECILKISAFYSGTNVFIHIQDDGAGIDLERVRKKGIEKGLIQASAELTRGEILALIFKPGFSTVEHATEISGRGVGMDVVKKNIATLRGSIDVTTEKDLGTSFAIRLPLALSIMDVMIVKVGALHYMVPHSEIEICTSEIFTDVVERKGYNLRYKDKLIPFLELDSVFDEKKDRQKNSKSILILNKHDELTAIEVDEIVGKEQVVIKPIDESLQMIEYLSGTSILGNGQLAFLVDVLKLKELYALER